MKPMISIIAAMDENRGIGRGNKLLWHIPEDLKRFRELTRGHPVIMGRTTFESIGKSLPERTNIIVTRDTTYKAEGCLITHSLEDAIKLAKEKDRHELFIIGGGQIYAQALPSADKLYVTLVQGRYGADTFFPDYTAFTHVEKKEERQDHNYRYTFLELTHSYL